jgi:ABC-type nickel/cobalt efflux system permease component RcnA
VFITVSSYSQNPLFNSESEDTTATVSEKPVGAENKNEPIKSIGVFNNLIKKNAEIQRTIKEKLANLSIDYKTTGNKRAVFIILMLAFLYGILHSLGPGHGKVFVFSYILTEKPKVLKAVGTSYAIAFIHGLSGLAVALFIVFTLNTYTSKAAEIDNTSAIIAQFSYALIIIIGVLLLIKTLWNKHKHHHHDKIEKIKFLPFVLSVGLVPCPGTIITVTFLSSMGMLTLGIISSFFIIMGMGITISLIGIVSLFSKVLVKRLFSANGKNYEKYYKGISIVGAALLVVFGLMFFMGTF